MYIQELFHKKEHYLLVKYIFMRKLIHYSFILLLMLTAYTSSEAQSSLYYLVREPKVKTANPPLLLLMHGVGSNEKDLFGLANYLDERYLIVSARAPFKIAEGSYKWYDLDFSTGVRRTNINEAEKSLQLILQFLDELQAKYHYDKQRVIVSGFSQGAIMSLCVGLTHPEKVRGIGVFSGRVLEEVVKPKLAAKDKFKHFEAFVSHGTHDGVLPVSDARNTKKLLESLQIKTSYHEYPSEHSISQANLEDFAAWLKGIK